MPSVFYRLNEDVFFISVLSPGGILLLKRYKNKYDNNRSKQKILDRPSDKMTFRAFNQLSQIKREYAINRVFPNHATNGPCKLFT